MNGGIENISVLIYMDKKPLVTISVVSFNSEEFVLETLESIKNQTYPNIELIISDDGSQDKTVQIEKEWLKKNNKRFVNSKLITVESNTGVTANSNRALEASSGIWWKIIAADDILLSDCIEKFINFVIDHDEVDFVFGKQISFEGDFSNAALKKEELPFRALFFNNKISAKKQYSIITKLAQVGCAPASFVKTSILRKVGGFNPRFPMNEDTPLYIMLTKSGVKLHYMDEYVVYRRRHIMSIMHQKDEGALLKKAEVRYVKGEWANYIQENSNFFWKRMSMISHWLSMKVIKNGNSKKSMICVFWYWCSRWLNPYKWYLIWSIIKNKCMQIIGY